MFWILVLFKCVRSSRRCKIILTNMEREKNNFYLVFFWLFTVCTNCTSAYIKIHQMKGILALNNFLLNLSNFIKIIKLLETFGKRLIIKLTTHNAFPLEVDLFSNCCFPFVHYILTFVALGYENWFDAGLYLQPDSKFE